MSWADSGRISIFFNEIGNDTTGAMWKRTSALDVDEIHIMCRGVNNRPEEHAIRDLTMEPNVLVGREKPRQAV